MWEGRKVGISILIKNNKITVRIQHGQETNWRIIDNSENKWTTDYNNSRILTQRWCKITQKRHAERTNEKTKQSWGDRRPIYYMHSSI